MNPLSPSHRDNLVRWQPTNGGGYESHFLKFNVVEEQAAFWCRFTILQPLEGPALFEVWAIFFDVADPSKSCAAKESFVADNASLRRDELNCVYGQNVLKHGACRGVLSDTQNFEWDFEWDPPQEGFRHFPRDDMYEGGFPKTKALSPAINTRFAGKLKVNGRKIALDGAPGMQGHNWGKSHADRWVWVHCNAFDDAPGLTFEAVSSVIKLGPFRSPTLTILHLNDPNGEPLTINGWVQMVRATSELAGLRWRFRGDDGKRGVEGVISAPPNRFVGLNYYDPNGAVTYCLNSKVADGQLRVLYRNGGIWRLDRAFTSSATSALEIGVKDDPRGVRIHG